MDTGYRMPSPASSGAGRASEAITSEKERITQVEVSPMSGLKVLDLSLTLPGPYASFLLSQLGATVTRVVPPWGDSAENFLPTLSLVHQGKRTLVLDLKTEEHQKDLLQEVESADVFLEGFRPGVASRLGADRRALAAVNPRLVYCSLSGYGQDSPLRSAPGHDINYESLAGAFAVATAENPVTGSYPRVPLADLAMTAHAVVAVLAGLRHRDTTGVGCYIDLAAADSLVSFVGPYIQALGDGQKLTKELPHYGSFEAADGKWLSIGIVYEPHFWNNLVGALDLPPEWASLDLYQRQAMVSEVRGVIESRIVAKERDFWIKALSDADVPVMPILAPSDTLHGDYFRQRGVVKVSPDGQRFIGLPFALQPLGAMDPSARP